MTTHVQTNNIQKATYVVAIKEYCIHGSHLKIISKVTKTSQFIKAKLFRKVKQ